MTSDELQPASVRDLSFLPPGLRQGARFVTDGHEVMWRRSDVVDVLRVMVSEGRVIPGLDMRPDREDLPTEVPWSSFEPGAAGDDGSVASLEAALEALERVNAMTDLDVYGWVLVTWSP